MHDNNFVFMIFTFVIVVTIIVLAQNLQTAVLILSLFANFIAIYLQMHNIESLYTRKSQQYLGGTLGDLWNRATDDQEKFTPEPVVHVPPVHTQYRPVVVPPIKPAQYDLDTRNTAYARARSRDQTAMTQRALKGADHYNYYYDNEFTETEARPWWGNYDYQYL